MVAVVIISKWVPIAVFSALAVYSAFLMSSGNRVMEWRLRRWQRGPRFLQALFYVFTFGQWQEWAFEGALFTCVASLAVVALLLFAHSAHHH